MNNANTILKLENGKQMVISDLAGQEVNFSVHIGDASLNGKSNQVWLTSGKNGETVYLRKNRCYSMSIGVALFDSLEDLANTLISGEYYFG